jgi:hypothetical protein
VLVNDAADGVLDGSGSVGSPQHSFPEVRDSYGYVSVIY